jgi:serine-type D-Ala-D-Ala carboxypeptidase
MQRWIDSTQPSGRPQPTQVIEGTPFVVDRRVSFTLRLNSAITREDHSCKASTQIPNGAPTPVPIFHQQDQQFSSAFSLLRAAIAQRVFPAASIAVTQGGKLLALKSFGKFVYEQDLEGASPLSRLLQREPSLSLPKGGDFNVEVQLSTMFDLASLTKPIATTTMAMILYERGLLELEAPVSGTIPELLTGDARRHEITFRMLLAHSSGLPAYEKLFLRTHSRDQLLEEAFVTPLAADPGTRAEYSDIGFIILGVALERIAGESLDMLCQREIFGPLGMASTTFNPPAGLRPGIPPTANERQEQHGAGACALEVEESTQVQPGAIQPKPRSTFRNRIIQGEVQDENAFVLGGVAGHAGLFSTAEDLARFAHVMLSGASPILRPETIAVFTRREAVPAGTSRALGWDTPSAPSQSGKYFGAHSYGHLGYTGTSLWIDPDRQLSITLLTNRTWPDCSNQAIRQVRPKIHDAIVEALHDPL